MARTANGKSDASDVAAQIDTIKADVAALTALLADLTDQKKEELKAGAADAVNRAKSRAKDEASMARARATEAGEALRDSVEDHYTQAEDAVRRQPAMAVGVAAGVGFLVGLLASRR